MFDHKGSKLAVQIAEKNQVSVTHFIQNRNQVAFSVCCSLCCLHCADVRDVTVVTNGIVVDVVTDVFYQTVVADRYISERCIVDTRVLYKSFTYFNALLKITQSDFSIEHHPMEIVRPEIFCYLYVCPVF